MFELVDKNDMFGNKTSSIIRKRIPITKKKKLTKRKTRKVTKTTRRKRREINSMGVMVLPQLF